MSRRILSVVVTVLGLVLVALAVCSATIWKPSSKVEATLASGPSQPYVITAPGVLSGTESDVAVTAKSSDGKDVHLFIARTADVEAWLSPDADNALPYTVVTGIDADAGTLESKDETQYCADRSAAPTATPMTSPTASSAPQASASAQGGATSSASGAQCSERKASAVNASGSDLWLGEKSDGSSVTFNTADAADRALLPHKSVDEQVVVMAMSDGKSQAPNLTVSWSRQVEMPWYFYGGLVLGTLFVLAGVFLFFIDLQLRRADVERRTRSAERAARIANADSTSTEGIPQVDDPDRRLTRRELRDKERAEATGEAWTDPRTGRVYLDGIEAPPVPSAPEALVGGGAGNGAGNGAGGGIGDGATGQEGQAVVGAARGSAVVPGLDEATTQQYRAARGLESLPDGEALAIVSDEPDVSGARGYAEAPAYSRDLSHHSHVAVSSDLAPERRDRARDSSRFAPRGHHTRHVAGEPDAGQTFESDTAEIEGLTPSVSSQDPGLQMPTGFEQPETRSWSVADRPETTETTETTLAPEQRGTGAENLDERSSSAVLNDSSTTSTVSWPSYTGGVELPPAADPAAIQAAEAEPLGETDPDEDTHNQEHA